MVFFFSQFFYFSKKKKNEKQKTKSFSHIYLYPALKLFQSYHVQGGIVIISGKFYETSTNFRNSSLRYFKIKTSHNNKVGFHIVKGGNIGIFMFSALNT